MLKLTYYSNSYYHLLKVLEMNMEPHIVYQALVVFDEAL